MKKKYLAIAALSMALAAGSAMTSFAAGFVHTSQGTKYQWGSGDYCTNNWVNYKNHWFFFEEDQIMRTGWIQKDGTWYYACLLYTSRNVRAAGCRYGVTHGAPYR